MVLDRDYDWRAFVHFHSQKPAVCIQKVSGKWSWVVYYGNGFNRSRMLFRGMLFRDWQAAPLSLHEVCCIAQELHACTCKRPTEALVTAHAIGCPCHVEVQNTYMDRRERGRQEERRNDPFDIEYDWRD